MNDCTHDMDDVDLADDVEKQVVQWEVNSFLWLKTGLGVRART